MQYQKIGNNDLNVSPLCLGTWAFGGDFWGGGEEQDCIDAVHCAIDEGINFIDTAPIYSAGESERIVGKAIKGKRDKVILATKCGLSFDNDKIENDLSPDAINAEIDESLKRLQVDYIDLYQCHWPDEKTPLPETLEALYKIQLDGKIRYVGLSNYSPGDVIKASQSMEIVTSQNQYSLLDRSVERDLVSVLRKRNIGLLAYGPLAGGILTGKYKEPPKFKDADARKFFYKYYSGKAYEKTTRLLEDLKQFNKPLNQVAINWVRSQLGVASVLVGCRNPQQVKDNVAALKWDFRGEQLIMIDKVLKELVYG